MSHVPKWILLPAGGYCFGIEARGKGRDNVELHGGFKTWEEAYDHKRYLEAEFSDYSYVKVVKIETPEVVVEHSVVK